MSVKVSIESLDEDMRKKIDTELSIQLEATKYDGGQRRYIYPHDVIDDDVILPFAYAIEELKMKRPLRESKSKMNVKFEGTLRDDQLEIKKEAIDFLNKKGSVMISLATGGGKTIISINLACSIKLKTLVVVNKIVLIKQWEQSILKFCPTAKVQVLKANVKFDDDCDFYIMNAQNIPKMGRSFFHSIQTLITDEAHLLLAERLSKLMLYVQPRYLIGLTATPERYDGLNILFDLYFGKDRIIRKMWHNHTVYRVNTGLKIDIVLTEMGKVNWNSVLEAQSSNIDRNELIVKIVKKFSDRVFLIIVKRVDQGKYILNRLLEENEKAASLLGSEQEFDRDCRILVGTLQKVGVGFDFDRVNALMLATDTEAYFAQQLGRTTRKKDNNPIVFDLVDKNPILEKHYNTRRDVYKSSGGTIKTFNLEDL